MKVWIDVIFNRLRPDLVCKNFSRLKSVGFCLPLAATFSGESLEGFSPQQAEPMNLQPAEVTDQRVSWINGPGVAEPLGLRRIGAHATLRPRVKPSRLDRTRALPAPRYGAAKFQLFTGHDTSGDSLLPSGT